MPIRTKKPKVEAESSEDADFADTLQSEGDIVSQLPARYRSGKVSRVHIFGPLVLFLAVVAGGYIGYDYFSQNTATQNTAAQNNSNISAPPSAEVITPSEPVPPAELPAEVAAAPVTVEVRNGTATAGLAKKVGDLIGGDGAFTVEKVGNASTKTFTKTQVVVLGAGVKSATASSLADTLNAELVLELPKGEVASTSDILIVLGQDQVTVSE